MDFDRISAVGLERAKLWHPGGLEDWSVSDWTVATAGEAGEVLNSIKKLRRVEQKISQKAGPQDMRSAQLEVGTEVGDTYLYLDLLAQRIGSTPFSCVCTVNGGYYEAMRGASLQRKGLILMSIMGEVSRSAMHADDGVGNAIEGMKKQIGMAIVMLDVIAQAVELKLEACVVNTFNRVSEREGFPQRL